MTFDPSSDCYQHPPKSVVDIVAASPEPSVILSPNGRHMLMIEFEAMPDLADLARPMHRLAGLRIDPQANTLFRSSYRTGLLYQPVELEEAKQPSATRVKIETDSQGPPKIGTVKWSHNNHDFVFTRLTPEGTSLYAADIETLCPRLIHPRFAGVLNDIDWMPDGKHLVFSVVPENSSPPLEPTSPTGPRIQHSDGETSPTRTYQDLLKNPYDEDLFAHHVTTEVLIADVQGKVVQRWAADMYADVSPAPDGIHFLVTRLKRPFSYLLTWHQFAMTADIFSISGDTICQIADIQLAENIPIEGVRTEPRMIHWMSSRPASLCYTTALDKGDPNNEADFRDQVWVAEAPFGLRAPPPLSP